MSIHELPFHYIVHYMTTNIIAHNSYDLTQASLDNLKDVMFLGNPMYEEAADRDEAKLRVLARLPQVTKIDGVLVKPSDIEAASVFLVD